MRGLHRLLFAFALFGCQPLEVRVIAETSTVDNVDAQVEVCTGLHGRHWRNALSTVARCDEVARAALDFHRSAVTNPDDHLWSDVAAACAQVVRAEKLGADAELLIPLCCNGRGYYPSCNGYP